MKSKKNFSPKDEKLNVFVPFVNLLLFEKLESPDFDSEYEKLSKNFLEAVKLINQTSIDFSDYFKIKMYYFITGLSAGGRQEVFENIIENNLFITTLSVRYILSNNLSMNEESTFLSQKEIISNLFDFKDQAKISKDIWCFFGMYFEHIFYVDRCDEKSISSMEYRNLIENLSIVSREIG